MTRNTSKQNQLAEKLSKAGNDSYVYIKARSKWWTGTKLKKLRNAEDLSQYDLYLTSDLQYEDTKLPNIDNIIDVHHFQPRYRL